MKKLALTIALIIGITTCTFAEDGTGSTGGTGLFGRANHKESAWGNWKIHGWFDGLFQNREGNNRGDGAPNIPGFGEQDDIDAPLGSGVAVLIGLGAAYLVGKKRKED